MNLVAGVAAASAASSLTTMPWLKMSLGSID